MCWGVLGLIVSRGGELHLNFCLGELTPMFPPHLNGETKPTFIHCLIDVEITREGARERLKGQDSVIWLLYLLVV